MCVCFLMIFILIYTYYFMMLLDSNDVIANQLLSYLAKIFISFLIAMNLTKLDASTFSRIYCKTILTMSMFAVLGLLVINFVDFSYSVAIPPRMYHTNFLAVWISDSGYDSSASNIPFLRYRLQGIYDEPGTYGVMAFPVLVYYFVERKYLLSFFMFIFLILSQSFNALVLIIIFLLCRLVYNKQYIALSFFISLSYFLFEYFKYLAYDKLGLSDAYLTNSSYSVRAAEYDFLVRNMMDFFAPSEMLRLFEMMGGGSISTSYVRWLLGFGSVLSIYFIFFLVWIFFTIVKSTPRNSILYFPRVLLFSLFFSGFQRASFLDNIQFMVLVFICVYYLKFPFFQYKLFISKEE